MTASRTLKPVLRIDMPSKLRLGRGKIELLEHIRDTGSITAAGRRMDMSYRRAWQLVDTINRMFTAVAVEAQRGGRQGGGAVVTPFGEELIARFRRMEMLVVVALDEELEWLESHQSLNDMPLISGD